jgi:predicted nucleic acid-binding protein
MAFSSWNIGEMIRAFDKACTKGVLSLEDYLTVKRRFLIETRRLLRLGVSMLVPVKLLIESWGIIEKYHIYEADALQIASAKLVKATQFFTGDKRVYEIASTEGLKSILIT